MTTCTRDVCENCVRDDNLTTRLGNTWEMATLRRGENRARVGEARKCEGCYIIKGCGTNLWNCTVCVGRMCTTCLQVPKIERAPTCKMGVMDVCDADDDQQRNQARQRTDMSEGDMEISSEYCHVHTTPDEKRGSSAIQQQ